jgi:hypothetical protein
LVLAKWEEFTGWLLDHCAKWPKSARFTLTQRVENHALDIVERLVIARYEPATRIKALRKINLRLERMRFLIRIAQDQRVMPKAGFETAMRNIDEAGRMIHGWRQSLGRRAPAGAEVRA